MISSLLILGILGTIIGSFTSVVTWRLPKGTSIVWPSSRCPKCTNNIEPQDNIPIISWIRLRGRCRQCNSKISIRYPLIEAAAAIIWCSMSLVVKDNFGSNYLILIGSIILSFILLSTSIIDIEYMRIPENFCIIGIIIGIIFTGFQGYFSAEDNVLLAINNHFLASFIVLVIMESIGLLGLKIFGIPVLGMGDAKLAAVGGAWIGIEGIFFAILLAFITGGLFGLIGRIAKVLKPFQPFPFGPFIAFGIWTCWIYKAII